MKIKVAVLAIVLALVAALAYSRFIAGHTPVGQPTLTNLDPASFEQQFRAAASGARILVMLSPTWAACLRGASAIESALEQAQDSRLHAFVIWEPMLPTDWGPPSTSVLSRVTSWP